MGRQAEARPDHHAARSTPDAASDAFVNGEVDVIDLGTDASAYKRAQGAEGRRRARRRRPGLPPLHASTARATMLQRRRASARRSRSAINRKAIAQGRPRRADWPARDDGQPLLRQHAGRLQGQLRASTGATTRTRPSSCSTQAGWKLAAATSARRTARRSQLRFVIPSGLPASKQEGELTQAMLKEIGVKLDDRRRSRCDDFFDKYVTPGQLRHHAVLAGSGTPFPISSARSRSTRKPTKDADGELELQQNSARIGTPEIDRLMRKRRGDARPGRGAGLHQPGRQADLGRGPLADALPAAAVRGASTRSSRTSARSA